MSQFCPEWIFAVCSATTAKEFLSSENSLNSISRKISGMFSSELDPAKTHDYSVKNVTKVFRATIFALRNHTVTDMQPGWTYEGVEGLDWLKDLLNKPTNILDNF